MHKNLLFKFVFVLLLVFVPGFGFAATLTLSPSSTSVSVNGTFTVNILLDTTGSPTYGVDINRLRFNPALLQVVDVDTVTAGVQVAMGSLMSVTTTNTVDNVGGSVQLSQLANPGSTYTGSGTFATITFRAVASGSASVTMDFAAGSGTDTNVAGLGSDLLTSVGSGTYTLNALDTTPPIISGGTPTGTLVYTTTSVTASITTNENATCRISSTANQTYASMTNMTTTGGTTHSTTVSGLTSGNSYTRYFRCSDTSGNQNTSDYTLTFSVAQVPDTTAPTISSIVSGSLTTSGATITWTTNELSDSQVEYGLTTSYGQSSTVNPALLLSHSVALSGLSSNSTYNYRVKSRDAAGNLATSINQTFNTLAPTPVQRTITFILEGTTLRNITGSIQYLSTADNSILGTASVTTNTSGQVTVTLPTNLPSTINIRPIATGYLSRNINNVDAVSTSVLAFSTPTMLAGDFNSDQIINSLDFSLMNSNWLTSNTLTDVNKDGNVNSLDFAYVSNNWLQIGQ